MASKTYSYWPIGNTSIRILEFSPGNPPDPLRGILHVRNGDPSQLNYECISYAWGSSDLTHSIELEGGVLAMTANLHDALEDFRLPPLNSRSVGKGYHGMMKAERERRVLFEDPDEDIRRLPSSSSHLLWADGICINQGDDQEKTGQVSRMAAYYGAAQWVLVHLGRPHTGGDLVVDLVRKVERYFSITTPEQAEVDTLGSLLFDENEGPQLAMSLPAEHSPVWEALGAMLDSPYWNRCWIIQELVKAGAVFLYCVSGLISLRSFSSVVFRAPKQVSFLVGSLSTPRMANVHSVWELWRRRSKAREDHGRWSLVSLLNQGRLYAASDGRDHIYGMLGLSHEAYGLREAGGKIKMRFGSVDLTHELVNQ
ncbi:Fc.00g016190.m01.CDS01 [Cosmosporella sp. VM-42]